MLEELKNYENLGSTQYFWELFNILKKDDTWTEKNISSYFLNKIINERSIFDGCLPLLKLSKIIYLDKKTKEVKIDFRFKYILHTKELCKQKLLEGFLDAFYKDENFYKIFSSNNISYDIVYKAIQINYSAFGLKYSNIRKLFIDFNFLKAHPNFPQKKLIVNYKWKQFFDKNFIPKIGKKKIDIEELRKNLEQQQINGEEAEKFVLNFEKNRLKNKKGIEWIAPYDASAGYDILSFKNINSKENNKFIEVKSYAGDNPYFYWSKNEISIARKKEKNYCLYLVNREDINSDSYKPLIVSDPIKNILSNNNWKKEINTYYIINNRLNR